MKIRVAKGQTIHTDGAAHYEGEEFDLPAADARAYIKAGLAEMAEEPARPEKKRKN